MSIIDINGSPYTSAQEDVHLMELKKEFREVLGKEIIDAMRKAKSGRLLINPQIFEAYIDQAYYMGRDK